MRQGASLALVLLLASASAAAAGPPDQTGIVLSPTVPHVQPCEGQLERLPPSERQGSTIDLSRENADEVRRIYRQLTRPQYDDAQSQSAISSQE